MTPKNLAPHVLAALAARQAEGRSVNLQDLVDALGVRRVDVRHAVSTLHREGLLDALTMRLSLQGFALGRALERAELRPVRRPRARLSLVDAA